jgi:hypothetical protein
MGELDEIPMIEFCDHNQAIINYEQATFWAGDSDIKHKKFVTLAYSMVLLKNFEILKNVNPYVEDPKIDKLYDYFV